MVDVRWTVRKYHQLHHYLVHESAAPRWILLALVVGVSIIASAPCRR
jgi:hypothetical protein